MEKQLFFLFQVFPCMILDAAIPVFYIFQLRGIGGEIGLYTVIKKFKIVYGRVPFAYGRVSRRAYIPGFFDAVCKAFIIKRSYIRKIKPVPGFNCRVRALMN